jgi:hypothetical protein
MNSKDDELRQRLENMMDVPFSDELRGRILASAERMSKTGWRRRLFGPSLWASLAGIGVVASVIGAVFALPPKRDLSVNPSTSANSTAVRRYAMFNRNSNTLSFGGMTFGLQLAPIAVQLQPSLKDGMVHAKVTNRGNGTIRKQDVFAVLAFPKVPVSELLSQADSMTFADGPDATLEPGQSAEWAFQPIGSRIPVDANGNISATLTFFTAHAAPISSADVVWRSPDVDLSHVTVHPRVTYTDAITHHRNQSFQVEATLTNRADRPVVVDNLRGVLWFGGTSDTDFTQPGVLRFIDSVHLIHPGSSATPTLKPGQSTRVYFREIGPADQPFLKQPLHIVILEKSVPH